MTNEKGYSMILLVVGILAISAFTFGAIRIYKDRIEAGMPDIFKNLDTDGEQINAENLVFELQEPESSTQDSTTQTNTAPKAELCRTEASQTSQQYLKEYEKQLKTDWPNYLGATYDNLMQIYSDPKNNKYVQDPEIRKNMIEIALNSAQQTIQKKLSEMQAAVYPQYLQECLNK